MFLFLKFKTKIQVLYVSSKERMEQKMERNVFINYTIPVIISEDVWKRRDFMSMEIIIRPLF